MSKLPQAASDLLVSIGTGLGALLFVGVIGLGSADYLRFLNQGEAASAAAWAGARSAVMAPPGGDREALAVQAALHVLGEDSELVPSHVAVRLVEDSRRGTLTVTVTVDFHDWAPFFPKPDSTTGISAWPLPRPIAMQ